jgi:hypothetical protein
MDEGLIDKEEEMGPFFKDLKKTVEDASKDPELQEILQRMKRIVPGRYSSFVYVINDEETGEIACFKVFVHTPPEGVDPQSLSDEELERLEPKSWPVSVKWIGTGDGFEKIKKANLNEDLEVGSEEEGGNVLVIKASAETTRAILEGKKNVGQAVMTREVKLEGEMFFVMRNPSVARFIEIVGEYYRGERQLPEAEEPT